jgi:hypothetical protein
MADLTHGSDLLALLAFGFFMASFGLAGVIAGWE